MKCPTVEQVQSAAKKSKFAREALEELFPEAFDKPIKEGQIYSWGTDSDGGSGLIILHPNQTGFSFINFYKGWVYLPHLPYNCTKTELNKELSKLSSRTLHDCYRGRIEGPKYLKSWCTK